VLQLVSEIALESRSNCLRITQLQALQRYSHVLSQISRTQALMSAQLLQTAQQEQQLLLTTATQSVVCSLHSATLHQRQTFRLVLSTSSPSNPSNLIYLDEGLARQF
jgi:hypothetical protein